MPGKTSQRIYAFLSAADQDGPMWEAYARRVGAPLGLGVVLGLLIAAIVIALPKPAGWLLVVALALGGLVWALWELRAIRRLLKETEKLLEDR